MENIRIKEIQRVMNRNKEKFRYDIMSMCRIFNVENKDVINQYDKISDKFIKYHIKKDEIEKKINEVSYDFEKLKSEFIHQNNIDIRKTVLESENGNTLLDQLFRFGIINNDMFEVLKDEIWRKRKTQRY